MKTPESTASHHAPDLSVVLPVYNERDTVRPVISRLLQVLEAAGTAFEVIAVNDCSTDGTRDILESLRCERPAALRLIDHPYNKGNGAAIKSGIRAARGRVIACMDADGQHDPDDLVRMLPWVGEYDLVVGARTQGYEGGRIRNPANRFINGLASWLTGFAIKDLTSGYRLFKASMAKRMAPLLPARFSYPTTSTLIVLKGGYNLKYVPLHVRPRQAGTSKIRLIRDGWRLLNIIFKIVLLYEPLRLFVPLAGALFLLALMSAGYSTWALRRLHIPNSSVVLVVMGALVFLLGFVAEQIASVRPLLRNDDQGGSD